MNTLHEVGGWYLSRHALDRMSERGFSEAEVAAALTEPEIVYCQEAYGPGRQVRQYGRIGVVVDPVRRTVITVVFRSPASWAQHFAVDGAA